MHARRIGLRAAGSVTALPVNGRGGAPIDAAAVTLNVTATEATGAGYVTVYPCGTPTPNTLSVNFAAGSATANAVTTKTGVDGTACFYTSTATHLIVDLNGTYRLATR